MTKIAIGAPIHNRALVVACYLDAIAQIDWPQGELVYVFLPNNCDHETMGILYSFAEKHSSSVIEEFNEVESTTNRGSARYPTLVELRNRLLKLVGELDCDYFLSADSDLIPPKDALKKLMSHEKDVVSGLVYNDLHLGGKKANREQHLSNIMAWTIGKNAEGYPSAVHITNYPDADLLPIDITGAFVLMSRKAYTTAEYRLHPQGEDLGWAIELQRRGIKAYCDTSVRPLHLMTRKELVDYITLITSF